MDKQEFYSYNWNTLSSVEQHAWLLMFCAKKNVVQENGVFLCENKAVTGEIDLDLIHELESNLDTQAKSIYIENLTSEISVQTYKGLSESQIQLPETTNAYYFNVLHAPKALKAKCLYYAMKSDYV
jgi:hypothetical protein